MSRLLPTLALLPFLVLGCTDSPTDAGNLSVEFETILQAPDSGLTNEGQQVVRNQTDWARVWGDLHAHASPAPPLPDIDFGRDIIVVTAMGERPDSCYNIEVAEVIVRGGRVSIRVVQTTTVGCACATVITHPVHVIRVRLVLPGIDFDVVQRTENC